MPVENQTAQNREFESKIRGRKWWIEWERDRLSEWQTKRDKG